MQHTHATAAQQNMQCKRACEQPRQHTASTAAAQVAAGSCPGPHAKQTATLGSSQRLINPKATTPTAYSTVTIIAAAARSRATGCADQQSPTKSSDADRPLISTAHREQRRGQITTPRRGCTLLNCWARPKSSAPAAMPVQPHFPPKPHTSSKTLCKTSASQGS